MEALRRRPEVVVAADPVAAHRAVVRTVGDPFKTHAHAVADVLVLPSGGRPVRSLPPPEARALFVLAAV